MDSTCPSICGMEGWKGSGVGKPLWCFIKDVVFPGNLRHSHRRCPVCLETKFVPRPPQPSGGSFFEQPLGLQGWGCLHGSGFYQAHLDPGGVFWFGRTLSTCLFCFSIGGLKEEKFEMCAFFFLLTI